MMNFSLIFTHAVMLFFTLDPIGNVGIVGALLSKYPPEKQRRILRREVLIALFVILLFFFAGSGLMSALNVSTASIQITGGIIFFLFGISLTFPESSMIHGASEHEPFIVPIAVPFIAGPSCLATIVLFSHESYDALSTLISIVLAWLASSAFVIAAPMLNQLMGERGRMVCERLVGLLCVLIATQMLLGGAVSFINSF